MGQENDCNLINCYDNLSNATWLYRYLHLYDNMTLPPSGNCDNKELVIRLSLISV